MAKKQPGGFGQMRTPGMGGGMPFGFGRSTLPDAQPKAMPTGMPMAPVAPAGPIDAPQASQAPMMPSPDSGAFARPGEAATMEEYQAAQASGDPARMALFNARNPGFVPPGQAEVDAQGLLAQLAAFRPAGPEGGPQFDPAGNLTSGIYDRFGRLVT